MPGYDIHTIIRQLSAHYVCHSNTQNAEHIDEEMLSCLLEGKLKNDELQALYAHLVSCLPCLEELSLSLELSVEEKRLDVECLSWLAKQCSIESKNTPLEIIVSIKDKLIELLSTNGDCLVGQELVSAPILRSRQIHTFKNELVVFKDFGAIILEVKIHPLWETKHATVSVIPQDTATHIFLPDVRITLLKGEKELESRLSDQGNVVFENIEYGEYTIEARTLNSFEALVVLKVQ